MLDKVIQSLVDSPNEAADELLLEAMDRGTEAEQTMMLGALLRRRTVYGLSGLVGRYDVLPKALQGMVLANIKLLHAALRHSGRSENPKLRLSAIKLVALGRQGKLCFILTDNLHEPDEALSGAAVSALLALAKWVASGTRDYNSDRIEQTRL